MKVLHSWLAEFVDLDGVDPDELGDMMSDLGLCCEEVRRIGGGLDGIVVAQVRALSPHPDADRIQLVQVDVGDGADLQICCGAFNMAVGDRVPLATLGTVMPGGLEIARRKLRGEWSNGMLCSAAEMELSDDSDGIYVLGADLVDPTVALGTAISDVLGVEPDVLYDLDLTPNRPDALSILGVARDLAARLGRTFRLPVVSLTASDDDANELASVTIDDPDLCGRFTGRVLSGVRIGSSDSRISRRLMLCGIRPINSVVDASNYVMLEVGQPNHTYDLDRIEGSSLTVRRATAGEGLVTLDGQHRELVVGDGVIADGAGGVVGLAGVMGGESTEISDSTSRVLLELAWWDPLSIGRTSKRLGLRSEASSRYEKGVDPWIASYAADRFASILVAGGATLHPGEIVVEGNLPDRSPITLRTTRVNRILGTDLTADVVAGLLDPIGFSTSAAGDDLAVELPSWRPDSTGEIDLIEEVARHFGYDRIGKTVPAAGGRRGRLTEDQQDLRRLVRTVAAFGADEAKPMPFLAPGDLERFGVRHDAVRVTNPLAAEESVLRTSTLPGLVQAIAANVAHRNRGVSLFEVGHCWAAAPMGELPAEWNELGVASAGSEVSTAIEVAVAAVSSLRRPAPTFTAAVVPGLHPTRSGVISVGATEVGEVGEVDPIVCSSVGVDERVSWLRLDLDALMAIEAVVTQVNEVSRYPSSDVDLAVVLADEVPAHVLIAALTAANPLVTDVVLFDVFRSEELGPDRRSLAASVRLQAVDRTLAEGDTTDARAALIAAVESVGGELRS